MNKTQLRKLLSLILCIVLIAATALFTTGCSDNSDAPSSNDTAVVLQEDGSVLGEGDTEFAFTVVDADGNEISCTILTDEETVGAADCAVDRLISGTEQACEYGHWGNSFEKY